MRDVRYAFVRRDRAADSVGLVCAVVPRPVRAARAQWTCRRSRPQTRVHQSWTGMFLRRNLQMLLKKFPIGDFSSRLAIMIHGILE